MNWAYLWCSCSVLFLSIFYFRNSAKYRMGTPFSEGHPHLPASLLITDWTVCWFDSMKKAIL